MNNRVEEYNDKIIIEQKAIFETSPKDNIDWALIWYLFEHSTPHHYGCLFEETNVITVGKVSKYFDLDYDDVYERLRRMLWWVNLETVYGYHKPFSVCSITIIGVKTIMKTLEVFERDE
jgi:hypothetical protein